MNRETKITIAALLLVFIFFTGLAFSLFTLPFVNLPAEYDYRVIYEIDGELPQNITLILPVPYFEGEVARLRPPPGVNVSYVEAEYGEMLKVTITVSSEIDRMHMLRIAHFTSHEGTIDVVKVNATLSPLLQKELQSRKETKDGFSEIYRIKVPVYAEFDGNASIEILYNVDSGFQALPFFFLPLPWEPKYGWKPYIGHKSLKFRIISKGWQVVEGEETIRIVYQRMF
ncbi:hypothetical protein GAH_01732 [Geoglobus ahangari]|uniref:Uncharacterized protein n=1 Tax=Geoglobus ahangari TaxID=113653 RepID=A0A0F7DBF2_9EURY|nr:hypothetical protein [Geoglobus ahangari]AKG90986.1 hypothetical protein GAH_01732 [Geoglobus ahangari]